MSETIRICEGHQHRKTPLIFTFAFPYKEYWCPYCGYTSGMLGAGVTVESTPELEATAVADKAPDGPAMQYLLAYGAFTCSRMKHEGKWISPDEMPQDMRDKYSAIIKAWRYETEMGGTTPAGAAPLPEEPKRLEPQYFSLSVSGQWVKKWMDYADTLRAAAEQLRARLAESEEARKRADIDKKRFERDWLEECDISHALKQRAEQAEAELKAIMNFCAIESDK